VCSLRDLLVGRGDEQLAHDEKACALANRHFDAILLHADPRLARLEESFRPATPLRVAVHYTGFVVPEGAPAPAARGDAVVVSAGGGHVGGPLMRAALHAQRELWASERRPMRLIAGPFLPEEEWRALSAAAEAAPGAELVRSVPVLRDELAGAAASVSQGGYNTTFDVLRAGVPALVVPFAAPGEDEQTRRARRLEDLGLLRVLDPARLDGPRLAAQLRTLPSFEPASVDLRLDGAAASARILEALVSERVREVAA
jgi:predicted glycosyltransferase